MARLLFVVLLVPLVLLTPCPAISADGDPPPTPVMRGVDPTTAKADTILTVTGENLGKQHVAEVYLTTGKVDVKLAVVEQADTTIKAKLPAKITAGKYNLMVLTARKVPNLIEQPVSVIVE